MTAAIELQCRRQLIHRVSSGRAGSALKTTHIAVVEAGPFSQLTLRDSLPFPVLLEGRPKDAPVHPFRFANALSYHASPAICDKSSPIDRPSVVCAYLTQIAMVADPKSIIAADCQSSDFPTSPQASAAAVILVSKDAGAMSETPVIAGS